MKMTRQKSHSEQTPLDECISALESQNDILGKARNAYLLKEAERKHFEAVLIRRSEGKSHAEKSVNAQATEEWLKFHKELARLESIYEFQKLKWDIIDKEYQALYLTLKIDGATMKRMGALA